MDMNRHILLITCLLLLFASNAHGSEGRSKAQQVQTSASVKETLVRAQQVVVTKPEEALELGKEALRGAELLVDVALEYDALRVLSAAELELGLYDEFMVCSIRALDLARSMGDPHRMAAALQDLSLAYRHGDQLDKALEESRNALAMVLPTRDQAAITKAQLSLIGTMAAAGQYSDAFQLGETTLARLAPDDELHRARIWHLLAKACLRQNKFGDAHTLLVRSEGILRNKGTEQEQVDVVVDRISVQLGLGRTAEAASLLPELRALAAVAEGQRMRGALLKTEFDVAVAQERWHEAVQRSLALRNHTDSLQLEKVRMRLIGLQVLHQLSKKEADLADLKGVNAEFTRTIAEQRNGSLFLLIFLCATIVFAAFLFISFRRGRRMLARLGHKNRLIKEQSEEIRLKNLELERQNMRMTEAMLGEEQKALMLQEVHHRVKNDLQVVDSLLAFQLEESNDPVILRVLRDAKGRIGAMAQVQEYLYRGGHGVGGSLHEHIERVGRLVLHSFGIQDRISLQVNVCEPGFGSDVLIPLSLLVNELITNSAKHAFNDSVSGSITIVIRPAGNAHELIYSDTGTISEAQVRPDHLGGFGMQLIGALAQQLNGELRTLKGAGMAVGLVFSAQAQRSRMAS